MSDEELLYSARILREQCTLVQDQLIPLFINTVMYKVSAEKAICTIVNQIFDSGSCNPGSITFRIESAEYSRLAKR